MNVEEKRQVCVGCHVHRNVPERQWQQGRSSYKMLQEPQLDLAISWTSLQAIAEVRFDVVSHFQKEVKTLREEFGRSRSDEVWSR